VAREDTDGTPAQPSDSARQRVRGVPERARRTAALGSRAQPSDSARQRDMSSGRPASARDPAFAPRTGARPYYPWARAWERTRASTASPPTRGTSTAIPGQSLPDSAAGVELAEAIAAICRALEGARRDTQQHGMRFEVEPVELTLHVGLARTGQGSAGIEWRVLRFDEPMLPQPGAAQTLTVRFAPRLADGRPTLANTDQPVPYREDAAAEPSLSVNGPNDAGM
jgi:Trypsin-co-occurring domain 2